MFPPKKNTSSFSFLVCNTYWADSLQFFHLLYLFFLVCGHMIYHSIFSDVYFIYDLIIQAFLSLGRSCINFFEKAVLAFFFSQEKNQNFFWFAWLMRSYLMYWHKLVSLLYSSIVKWLSNSFFVVFWFHYNIMYCPVFLIIYCYNKKEFCW